MGSKPERSSSRSSSSTTSKTTSETTSTQAAPPAPAEYRLLHQASKHQASAEHEITQSAEPTLLFVSVFWSAAQGARLCPCPRNCYVLLRTYRYTGGTYEKKSYVVKMKQRPRRERTFLDDSGEYDEFSVLVYRLGFQHRFRLTFHRNR